MERELIRHAMVDDERGESNANDCSVPALDWGGLLKVEDLDEDAPEGEMHRHFVA